MTEDRVITLRQALDEAEANNEILVGVDDYIERWNGAHILHCVINYEQEGYPAYMVEITRPRHLYGGEGQLFRSGLRYVGASDDSDLDRDERELSAEDWKKIPDADYRMFAFRDSAPAWKDKPIEWKLMERGIFPALEAYRNKWKPVPY